MCKPKTPKTENKTPAPAPAPAPEETAVTAARQGEANRKKRQTREKGRRSLQIALSPSATQASGVQTGT